MNLVPLTRGQTARVDDEDFDRVMLHSWQATETRRNGNLHGWSVTTTMRGADGKSRNVKMSRFILNAPDDVLVDHKSGDGLDNQKANLRYASYVQNGQNRKTNQNNRTGFKGVRRRPSGTRFQVRIVVDGKRLNIGNFRCPVEAAHAYDAAAREHFGEFARLNFPDNP